MSSSPVDLPLPPTPAAVNNLVRTRWSNATIPECLELSNRHCIVRLSFSSGQEHLRPPGNVAGGPIQFAIMDTAAWFLCGFGAVRRYNVMAVTQSFNIKFLRPAVVFDLKDSSHAGNAGWCLYVRADLISMEQKNGKDVVSFKAKCYTGSEWKKGEQGKDGKPCSEATGIYSVPSLNTSKKDSKL